MANEEICWNWQGRIPSGAITILEGNPGDGKSTMLCDLAARTSSGGVMPDTDWQIEAAGVLWISNEDAPSTTRRNLEASGADLGRVMLYDKRAGVGPWVAIAHHFRTVAGIR